jgi:HK97 family phage portal protein
MRLFGLNITRTKAAPPVPVSENRGGWFRIFESYAGAWQQNVTVDYNTVLSYHAVYACMTLIAQDISKLRVKLVEQDADGIWTETNSPAYSPVLRKPNGYQNRIQFWESWILSKLARGNTYVLKVRDGRGVVVALYVLDPNRVKAMVSDDGSVWYQLSTDNMAGGELVEEVMVPASEIIHDRFNCLFHPLIGTSPIFAAGVAATQGINIQNNSATFFGNASRPSGVLTAPGAISDETAARLKTAWETKFSGENAGKVAVLGDGLSYTTMSMSAEESQLIDQLKWTAEVVCSTFHVPPYKIGVGTMPTYSNIQSLNIEYYSQCLQSLIEAAELCLDEGLGIGAGVKVGGGTVEGKTVEGKTYGTEFDVENLLRMDSVTQMDVLDKAKGVMAPNEQRKKLDLKPVDGGDSPMLQQQNYSLAALAKRDAKEDPFATGKAPAAAPAPDNDNEMKRQAAEAMVEILKGLRR